jgi:hypothetical protein
LAHVVQQGGRQPGGSLQVAPANDSAEGAADRSADQALSGGRASNSTKAEGRLQRLGANANCNKEQADAIHQGIYDANSWCKKTATALAANPLAPTTLTFLQRNFGASGTAANAATIAARLEAGRADMFKNAFSCADASKDPLCKIGCGASAPGSHASTICTDVQTRSDAVAKAGCVLHEAMHASDATMNTDSYSGWQGRAKQTPGYPGATPLTNADSYASLAMDMS